MDGTAEIIFNDLDRSKDGKISVYEFQHNAGESIVSYRIRYRIRI